MKMTMSETRRSLLIGVATVLVACCSLSAVPLGTAFTYQGRLESAGAPFSGTADLRFTLYDAAGSGLVIAGPLTLSAVNVVDGQFSVLLDFGAGAFVGEARWIQIEVRSPVGAGSYTLLSPRQPLTPAPFALFSLSGAGGGGGPWGTIGPNIYYTGGNVGIGNTVPTHRLRVSGGPLWTSNQWTGSLELDNAAAIAWRANAGGRRTGIGQSTGGLYFFNSTSDPGTTGTPANYSMIIADNGNVGIGSAVPGFPLTITTSSSIFASGYGWVHTNGTCELGSYLSSDAGWLGTRTNHPLYFFTNDSTARVTLSTSGNLGVGTTDPGLRLDVNGRARMRRGSDPSAGIWFQEVSDRAFVGMLDNNYVGFYGQGGIGWGLVMNVNDGRVAIGHANPQTALHVNGTTRTNVLEVIGADLAEKFPTEETEVEPGTVMEIDPEHSGQIRIARAAYSGLVAGVVSGAGDLSVGAVLGNLPGHEDAPPIALSGRVWVRCDTTVAAIAPGDLLTTSQTPGHAMKAVDRDRSHGAILGKAMTSLDAGQKGLVLVLVNLQ